MSVYHAKITLDHAELSPRGSFQTIPVMRVALTILSTEDESGGLSEYLLSSRIGKSKGSFVPLLHNYLQ